MRIALLDGRVSVESFSNARRFAADMEAMLERTHVNLSSDIPSDIDRTYSVVRVRTTDGVELEARCDVPRGFPGVPLSRPERIAKFNDCVGDALSPAASADLVEAIESLEDSPDVASIMGIASSANPVNRP
jgi:2-methylcitrate dehydratase PrpD